MKKRLIYFYPIEAPFVDKDIASLSHSFEVTKIKFNYKEKKTKLGILLAQLLFLVKNINKTDAIIVKFASIHSFLPGLFCKSFGKKFIIITGGTDCVSFPSINYGNFTLPLLKHIAKASFRFADLIIPVHESLILSEYTYNNDDYKQQGLKVHFPTLKTPFIVAYNGYNSEKWYRNSKKIKATFITVASYSTNERRRKLKGIDLLIAVAKEFPNCTFIIIGTEEKSFPPITPNIILLPWVDNKDLITHYSQAEFYLQLSMSEGFPNSLCEAMLCECVPIVSHVASMPFIVSDSGFVLERKDLEMLKELIDKALESDTEQLGKKARLRIADNFTEEKRAKDLIAAVESVFHR